MTKSNTFCILPWMHLATNASGNLRVCCNSTPGKNFITQPDGTPYKLWRDNLTEAWNSDTYKTIRKQLLNDERPEMCQRCFREEDAGLKSARIGWNQKWAKDQDYELEPEMDIKYVDLRLGNLCNLRCRMCNPYSSNQWVDEWKALTGQDLGQDEFNRLKTMDWPENPKTWENLFALSDTVEEIYLTGGEPTVIREQHRLLQHFIDKGTAKDIRLKYNINMTNIPKHLLDMWAKFKRVQVNCSIDAYGDLNRYIRYPSRWKSVQKTWDQIRAIPNVSYEIHCTVQMYNILNLNKLIDWAEPYNTRIYFNILNHPEELNIRVLPLDLKDEAAYRLSSYKNMEKIQGVIDYMYAEDWSNRLDDFYRYTDVLDKSRNEKLADHVPELTK